MRSWGRTRPPSMGASPDARPTSVVGARRFARPPVAGRPPRPAGWPRRSRGRPASARGRVPSRGRSLARRPVVGPSPTSQLRSRHLDGFGLGGPDPPGPRGVFAASDVRSCLAPPHRHARQGPMRSHARSGDCRPVSAAPLAGGAARDIARRPPWPGR